MGRFIGYIKDTKSELKHVSWPTTKQTTVFTVLVIAISLLVSLLLGFFDFVFTNGLDKLLIF